MSAARLSPAVRELIAREIAEVGGNEVSFVAVSDDSGRLVAARPVARGTPDAVLALPGVAARGEMVLHNHPDGVLQPSNADLDVAARLHDGGVGFGIVNNEGTDLYVVVEVPRPRARAPIDSVATAGLLSPGGPVARRLGTHENRPSQQDMAAHVADCYNHGGIALLEAGTGVGKSFAYLVPAIVWALANRERTIVSTNTINLQEQLVGKDLPLLARALGGGEGDRPVRFALLKGWRNYLCLARLSQARGAVGSLLEPERRDELETVAEWAATTGDGSLSDLAFAPSPDVWDEVAAESDLCTRLRCRHFDRCFVFAARRRAADADVVVVNHHLLASDLAVRRAAGNWDEAAVLPPYRRLVLDEGHHMEDVAAEHLGKVVSSRGVERLLSRLERQNRGVLPALRAVLAADAKEAAAGSGRDLLAERVAPPLADARRSAERLFRLLDAYLTERSDHVVRLGDEFGGDPIWQAGLGDALESVGLAFAQLRDGLAAVSERAALPRQPSERLASLLLELRGIGNRLDVASDALRTALRPPPPPGQAPLVRWLERRGTGHVGLAAVPLELAPVLREALFDRVETAVVTSATLAADGSFDFLASRLGVDLPPALPGAREVLPSPFVYEEQCLLAIPTDLPEPRADPEGHNAATVAVVSELAELSDGGIFVLFTSHRALRAAAGQLRSRPGVGSRWPLLVQGEGPRDQLLRRFRDAGSAILLGTDSFWEGVDVPGLALRALVLEKLPFRVPSEPLTAARLEAIEREGGNGFSRYLVPLAALKLKQGFGRLIRTREDLGVVLLLDRRVLSRRYGRSLLAGLPPAARLVGKWPELRERIGQFFAAHGIGVTA